MGKALITTASVLALLKFFAGDLIAQQILVEGVSGEIIKCGIVKEPYPGLKLSSGYPSQAASVSSFRVDPTVIRNNGADTFTLSVGTDTNVVALSIRNSASLLYQGTSLPYIQLFDDGTHGDQMAGDKIFTVDNIRFSFTPIFPQGRPMLTAYPVIDSAIVTYSNGSTARQFVDMYAPVRFIDPSVVPIPNITSVAPDMYKTDYCVNIVSPVVAPNYSIDFQQTARRYYSQFPDDRDFLIVTDLFNRLAPTIAGQFFSVRNDVQGIGKSVYNYTSNYGSSGTLQGLVHMLGGADAGLLAHELLHRWAAFFDASLGLASGSHWKAIQRPTSGFGPYWGAHNRFEYLSGKSFRGWFNPDSTFGYYSDLELYLMGLVNAADVTSPIQTLANPIDKGVIYNSVTRTTYRSFEADSVRNVTISEVVNRQGQRMPGIATSQKQFSSSLIIVYDRQLTEVEFAYYDLFAREYEKSSTRALTAPSFQAATGGRATMSTRISGAAATTAPVIPVLLSPTSGTTGVTTSPILTWNPSTGAATYRVQVSTSSSFETTVLDDQGIATASRQVGPLLTNTRYFWRVNATNAVGTSPFSAPWSFTTMTAPPAPPAAPSLSYPPDRASGVSTTVVFQWRSSATATSYRLQVSANANFSSSLVDQSEITGLFHTVYNLAPATVYYWRVLAMNAGGAGSFSSPYSFTTAGPSSVEQISSVVPKEFQLSQNYPNPFNPTTTFQFSVPSTSFVSLKLFDLLGREVAAVVSEELSPGVYRVRWNAATQPSGVYIYRIVAGEFVAVKQLVLLK